ncbi:MAG: site-specific DNA-methyltransferase [Thermoplasmata archaeon]|nr:site-specific DNA-methyltransferase [Thermoplasmata archaeon]
MPPARPFARLPLGPHASVVLWCEDAIVGLPRRLPSRGVDVVVTSPPYNRKVAYSTYSDDRPRAEYLAWIGELRDAVDAVLAPAGSFFLNVGGAPSDPFLPLDVARETARTFVLQNVIHWVKSIAIDRTAAGRAVALDRDLALGHYRPMASDRYVHGAHEYVFHFSRRGDVPLDRLAIGVPYQDKSNVARWGGAAADLRCRGNTWFLPYPTIRHRARDRPHPASFPPELPEWCLRLHGRERVRLAVDPFVGIGSSAVAAARLGVPFVGFDVDREYLSVAVERVRAERTSANAPTRPSRKSPARAGSTTASASG